ncbi:MAG: trehalose-6-phosphate synthase [Candidatus Omnitrophica bacterium]|nr:trehalose-6-phosphate synthase [Candidatus Omnitrophota bacterium]
MTTLEKRLVVVSNRLPIVVTREGESWEIRSGSGGLVTALVPVMSANRGLWIGWSGVEEEGAPVEALLKEYSQKQTYDIRPVLLSPDEASKFYRGFSNETLWPLFHDLLGQCKFESDAWDAYVNANRHFAETIAESLRPDDVVWIHDYQLLLVGRQLRQLGVTQPIGFFLHTPFPSQDLIARLPWKRELMSALLDYSVVGFQTLRDRRNFRRCVGALVPGSEITRKGRQRIIRHAGRITRAWHNPISIDFAEFNDAADTPKIKEWAEKIRQEVSASKLILGLDRLDYTKGIPERYHAFEKMLEQHPELHGKVSLLQVVVPSRTRVPGYQNLKGLLEGLAGRINGRFARHGWVPIHYMFRALDREELLAHYLACEVCLVTPLRDGMNLVAKEYCAARVDNRGVLVLSEFTGAADALSKGALAVNPYHLEGTAEALYQALTMDPEEQSKRMTLLRSEIRRNNVHKWLVGFMESLYGADEEPAAE